MIRRLIELLSLTATGGWTVLALGAEPMQIVGGAGGGALLWLLIDQRRLNRYRDWLREGRGAGAPNLRGDWADLIEYSQKVVKQLERQTLKVEQRFGDLMAAIHASPNGIVVLDSVDRIELANQSAANHLGFDHERDRGQYVRNLIRAPDFAAYLRAEDFSCPVVITTRASASVPPRRISLQLHPYGKGQKLLLSRDISAIEMADTMRRDFVANVSHEIRTPLTVLAGFVETMLSFEVSPEERERYLLLMNQQAQRMMSLVNDLLLLSRLEGSPAPGNGEWMAASELLDHVVEDARALSDLIADGAHQIVVDDCPDFELAGARTELLSAMSNLLGNAVRYTPPGGRIRVGWSLIDGGGVEYRVSDTGPGIEAEHLPRLTERFYRVDRSRSRESGGTGLGLAIVKHVVQRHGGQLRIESVVGQGSTFRILLPAARVRHGLSA